MPKRHRKRSRKRNQAMSTSGYRVYDRSQIWHIDAGAKGSGLVEGIGKLLGSTWRQAQCGYYFQPDLRKSTWKTCSKCQGSFERDLTKADATRSRVIDITPRKRLPKLIVEQQFEPPELE